MYEIFLMKGQDIHKSYIYVKRILYNETCFIFHSYNHDEIKLQIDSNQFISYCIFSSIMSNTKVSLSQHELRKMTLNFQFVDKNCLI